MEKNINKKYIKTTKKQAIEIVNKLDEYFYDAKCGLDFSSDIQLVVALILAAQCTDARVNIITPILFDKYPDVYSLSKANLPDIEKIIKPCGFYKNKAISILETANIIVDKFSGNVPNTMNDLCTLRGIGRKSANIILQECFNNTVGIAVDTHVTRLSRKMGLSNKPTPNEIEKELTKKFPKEYWKKINHIFVYHGRKFCIARRPNCTECPIKEICPKND